jgi:hypothetical protein
MGTNPSYYKGPKNPAENVLWLACQTFLGKLNDRTGTRNGVFVLPTEAQWEYACRAGSTTRWCFGDDESKLRDYAWYGVNAGARTHPVGQKKPNAWGLYDMYGNVSEWCADWFDGGYYRESPAEDPRGPGMGSDFAVRGGWWGDSAARAGSAARTGNTPAFAGSTVGLRVARTIPSGAPAPSAVPYPGMMPGATPPPGMAGSAPSSFPGMPALPPALPGSSNPLVADIEKDRVYQFGDWRMSWPSPGNYVHFWYKEGGTALEIVGASNGWWHWRDGTVEHIVWSNGSVGGQAFYRRPWTQLNREAIAVNGGFREFAVGANWGATRISSNGRELTVTLADGGKISLSPTTSVVQFTTHQGKRTQLPSR